MNQTDDGYLKEILLNKKFFKYCITVQQLFFCLKGISNANFPNDKKFKEYFSARSKRFELTIFSNQAKKGKELVAQFLYCLSLKKLLIF